MNTIQRLWKEFAMSEMCPFCEHAFAHCEEEEEPTDAPVESPTWTDAPAESPTFDWETDTPAESPTYDEVTDAPAESPTIDWMTYAPVVSPTVPVVGPVASPTFQEEPEPTPCEAGFDLDTNTTDSRNLSNR